MIYKKKQLPRSMADKNTKVIGGNEDVPKRFFLRRWRNKINYADLHKGGSALTSKPINRVPVYQQKSSLKEKVQADVYEFDFDSEMQPKSKNGKNMLEIKMPVEKRMKNTRHKIERRLKEVKKERRNGKGINVENKIGSVRKYTKNKANKIDDTKYNGEIIPKHLPATKHPLSNPVHDDRDLHDTELDLSDIGVASVDTCSVKKSSGIEMPHETLAPRLYGDFNSNLSTTSNSKSIKLPSIKTNTIPNETNTKLSDSSTSPFPNDNSTPWRPDFQVKRNPFFLQYKETLLPSYNQDMVIDSSATEKVVTGNKTPKPYNRPRTKQTSMLSYLNGKSVGNSSDVMESSLYDIHELSPIKSLAKSKRNFPKSSSQKENQLSTNTAVKQNDVSRIKRQILGDRFDNSSNILNSTGETFRDGRNSKDREIPFETDHSASNAEDEKVPTPKKKVPSLLEKLMTLDDYLMIARTSEDGAINTNFKQPPKGWIQNESTYFDHEDEEENPDREQEFPGTVGLFEDLEIINKDDTFKTYERVRKKRRRRNSASFEENGEVEHFHIRKKKKDKMTKEEEEKAEKWARDFNEMCKEVEDFPLEIE